MIVQLTSSTTLPWVCTGLRSSPGRSRKRIATKIVIADDRRPDHDRDPEERREEVEDLVRRRAGRVQRVLLVVGGPSRRSSRARQRQSPCRRRSQPRAGAVACGPTSTVLAETGSWGEPTRGDSTTAGFAGSQLCDSKSRTANSPPGPGATGAQSPRRSSDEARRCQSRSTRTWVSRCTRTPSSASSSRRASVPAWRSSAAPRPITIPRLGVALHAYDQAQREQRARPWSCAPRSPRS